MNERIKEIARQAGYYQERDFDGTRFLAMPESSWKKFAELIIKECAATAMTFHNSTGFDSYEQLDPYEKGVDDVASLISSTIRRNFGV